jgi:hypothetical protein
MLDDTYARATCRCPVDLVAAHVFDLLRDLRLISERIEEEEHAVSVVLIERFLKDGQSALEPIHIPRRGHRLRAEGLHPVLEVLLV